MSKHKFEYVLRIFSIYINYWYANTVVEGEGRGDLDMTYLIST